MPLFTLWRAQSGSYKSRSQLAGTSPRPEHDDKPHCCRLLLHCACRQSTKKRPQRVRPVYFLLLPSKPARPPPPPPPVFCRPAWDLLLVLPGLVLTGFLPIFLSLPALTRAARLALRLAIRVEVLVSIVSLRSALGVARGAWRQQWEAKGAPQSKAKAD